MKIKIYLKREYLVIIIQEEAFTRERNTNKI